jgi:hypothetical protein
MTNDAKVTYYLCALFLADSRQKGGGAPASVLQHASGPSTAPLDLHGTLSRHDGDRREITAKLAYTSALADSRQQSSMVKNATTTPPLTRFHGTELVLGARRLTTGG